jgi:hypothetical protein
MHTDRNFGTILIALATLQPSKIGKCMRRRILERLQDVRPSDAAQTKMAKLFVS